jgi:glycogen phosphorylase
MKLEQDVETNQYLRLIFLPNYTTTKEYLYVPALDISCQLVLPGKQSCSTQPLKFVMNGSIVLGSRDATSMRIENVLGENIALLFGLTYQ